MRVSVIIDLRNPPGWRRDWAEHYARTLEFVVEAERLGVDAVKLSEHHLFDDGLLSQPLTVAAAIAARTTRIRIVAGALAPLIHPQALAEQAAIVDVLSGGRLELALGTGYRLPEFEAFGVDPADRWKALERSVAAIRSIWASGSTLPQPVQRPLPLWLMADGAIGARRAGRLGAGLLSQNPELYEPYLEGLAQSAAPATPARIDGIVRMTFSEDPEADWPRFSRYIAYREDSIRAGRVEGTGAPAPAPVDTSQLRLADGDDGPTAEFLTPEAGVAEILRRAQGRPVVGVQFFLSVAGMPDDLVAQNLRLIAQRVRPLLQPSSR